MQYTAEEKGKQKALHQELYQPIADVQEAQELEEVLRLSKLQASGSSRNKLLAVNDPHMPGGEPYLLTNSAPASALHHCCCHDLPLSMRQSWHAGSQMLLMSELPIASSVRTRYFLHCMWCTLLRSLLCSCRHAADSADANVNVCGRGPSLARAWAPPSPLRGAHAVLCAAA